jgi:hypothetical protein
VRFTRWLIVAAPVVLMGCYSYSWSATAPAPGQRLAIQLTDAGRVSLAGHIGNEVDRVDGWLMSLQDSAYTLQVEQTTNLRGGTTPWNRETVRIPTAFAARVMEKRFSAPRTAVLAGTVTAGIVGFLASRGLLGSASGGTVPPPGGGGGSN